MFMVATSCRRARSGARLALLGLALIASGRARAQSVPAETAPSQTPAPAANPDIAAIADATAAWLSEDDPLQSVPDRTGFALQEVELSFQHAVDPYFRLDVFVGLSAEGVELEEAYGTTLGLPASLQLRAGKFLTRFGRLNATHSHSWDFVDRPFAFERVFGPEGNGAPGVELSWLTPLPWYVELIGSATEATGEGARSFYGEEELAIDSPLDFQNTLALQQFFPLNDDWSLLFGLSTAHGPTPTTRDGRTEIYGSDLYLKYRPITYGSFAQLALQLEVLWRRRQVPGDLLQDFGGYATLSWRFAQRWETAARYEYASPPRNRDGDVTADDLDPEWTAERQRVAASLSFRPTEFSRLRLQGSLDLPDFRPDPEWALVLAIELGIGAHAAHKF
jgi:hypothetical protein